MTLRLTNGEDLPGATGFRRALPLKFRRRPEFAKGAWPAAIDDALARVLRHVGAQLRVVNESAHRIREVFDVVRFRDQTVETMTNEFFWSAEIGDNHRQSTRLRFDDDVTERVGRARENKNVGRSVRFRQLLAFQVTGKDRFGQTPRPAPASKVRGRPSTFTGKPSSRSW